MICKIKIWLLFMTSFVCFSQHETIRELKLKGKVKSIYLTEKNAKENFGKIEVEMLNGYNNFTEYRLFNIKGNCIKYTSQTNRDTIQYQIKDNYLYNEKGKIIEILNYEENGELSSKTKFKYDNLGNLTDEIFYLSGTVFSSQKMKYDKNKLKEIISFDIDGNQEFKKIFVYYQDGNLEFEEISVFDSNDSFEIKTINTYDINKNLIESRDATYEVPTVTRFEYDKNGNLIKQYENYTIEGFSKLITYKYDDKNNLILETYFDENEREYLSYRFNYVYDLKGNWIKKIIFENEFVKNMIERKILYYQ